MFISLETLGEIDKRLLEVIAKSECRFYEGSYAFEEFPLQECLARLSSDALALVRDDQVWSQLVPSVDTDEELYGLFRFHFPVSSMPRRRPPRRPPTACGASLGRRGGP